MSNYRLPAGRLGVLGTERLTSFLAVIDRGGFSAAAETLMRSQSRVSIHVSELETALGAPLIDRASRPVVPTDIGLVFATHARKALDELRIGAEHVDALLNLEEGEVRVGSYGSASISFLPGVLQTFAAKYPAIHVALLESTAVEAEAALANRVVTLAIRTLHPPIKTAGVRLRPLWNERLVLVLPEDHPAKERMTLAGVRRLLRREKVISVGAGPGAPALDVSKDLDTVKLLHALGVPVDRVVYTLHPQALISMVRVGLGVGIVNNLAVESSDHRGIVRVPLDLPEAQRQVGLCWYEGHYHSMADRMLFDEIVKAPPPVGTVALGEADKDLHQLRGSSKQGGADS
ncbi:LysR family transcriptional regulator [Microbacterium sp. NPDC055910]|uniref:LysR family transcriptional regulator n=1 Tax=Microbacterium sp. NPDC055910 TaxID=3345659 RepID=UPI0035DF4AE2